MKLNRVKHHFALGGLIHRIEVFPFTGDWNYPVALYDGNTYISELQKLDNNCILVEKFGFEIPFENFVRVTEDPNFSLWDLFLASTNILIHSYDEYEIAKFAKSNLKKYGYFYNSYAKKLHYYILKNKPRTICNSYFMIDPNNPF